MVKDENVYMQKRLHKRPGHKVYIMPHPHGNGVKQMIHILANSSLFKAVTMVYVSHLKY